MKNLGAKLKQWKNKRQSYENSGQKYCIKWTFHSLDFHIFQIMTYVFAFVSNRSQFLLKWSNHPFVVLNFDHSNETLCNLTLNNISVVSTRVETSPDTLSILIMAITLYFNEFSYFIIKVERLSISTYIIGRNRIFLLWKFLEWDGTLDISKVSLTKFWCILHESRRP